MVLILPFLLLSKRPIRTTLSGSVDPDRFCGAAVSLLGLAPSSFRPAPFKLGHLGLDFPACLHIGDEDGAKDGAKEDTDGVEGVIDMSHNILVPHSSSD